MKNFIKLLACCVVLAITLVGCKSSYGVMPPTTTETNKETTTKEIVHDTVFHVEKDSSYYHAYLDCVNGKVVIKEPSIVDKKGKRLNAPSVKIDNNQLQINCYAEAQRIFYNWKETYTREHSATTIKIPYPVKLPLTTWETIEVWFGRVFMLVILAFLVLLVLKYIIKI